MDEREALLRGLFAEPENLLRKLVFADYLEERDEGAWAGVLRMSCEMARLPPRDTSGRGQLLAAMFNAIRSAGLRHAGTGTGFVECTTIAVTADELMDRDAFRRKSAYEHPEWFGARELKVTTGPLTTREPLVTLLTAPATQCVTHLDLSGAVLEVPAAGTPAAPSDDTYGFYDLQRHPLITSKMVEHLVTMRECRRVVRLDLRNNGLGNDALRAVAASPHLHRLKYLLLLEGNDFKGRAWQAVQERFGEDVLY